MSDLYPAVILAGGKAKPEIVAATGVENRALIRFDGKTMLGHVLAGLQAAPHVGKIAVVGDLPESEAYVRIADQGGFVENLLAGLAAVGPAEYALVSTCDIPFVTGAVVEDFVTGAAALGADMVYPVVRVETCYARFPGIRRTSLPLREGRLTGGNMVFVRPKFMFDERARIVHAYAARKSPLRLALMLGIGTTLRVAIAMAAWPRVLGIRDLEVAVGRLMGGSARAYFSDYPEIATDIDRPSDLEALKAH